VLLLLAHPDLLHDLDAGELKLTELAAAGLPQGETLRARLAAWRSPAADVHLGGGAVVSLLFLLLSAVFGKTILVLRAIPVAAWTGAAALLALWAARRTGRLATLLTLALLLGAPPIALKWSCVARGSHTEAVIFPVLLVLLLDRALSGTGRPRAWFGAGAVAGFGTWFSYAVAPGAAWLLAGAGLQAWRQGRGSGASARGAVRSVFGRAVLPCAAGGVLGFSPWILSLLWLRVPYFSTAIHQSGRRIEGAAIRSRGLLDTLEAALSALPRNLWPWTVTEAKAAAYASPTPDHLDFAPSGEEWLARGFVCLLVLLGIAAAARRRDLLLLAWTLLPALHYLAVVRLSYTTGWPLVPHRYLLIALPAVASAAALGAADLMRGPRDARSRTRRAVGLLLAASILLFAAFGIRRHFQWLDAPSLAPSRDWDAVRLHARGLGQVRVGEGAALLSGLDALGETKHQKDRAAAGARRVFGDIADYHLLFRRETDRARPEPRGLFSRPKGSDEPEDARRAEVRGALLAARIRAHGDGALLAAWACTWGSDPGWTEAVRTVLEEELPGLACP
jgi:hypothetical protein